MKNYLYHHFQNFHFTETAFDKLMSKRIYKVLLICSRYDAFILEEDGRIDEQLFTEYVSLNLRYPPEIIHVSTAKQAIKTLENEVIDLVINMLSVEDMDPFDLSKLIKTKYPIIPIVVLTPFSREVSNRLANIDIEMIDYVFSWLGDVAILLAIIKLLEDKLNAEYDVNEVGVQTIILVEDSVRYYSAYLPTLYKVLINQAKKTTTEGLNDHQRMIRMRGRPKILLATTFEEAWYLYEKYEKNLLGVISDISYGREGKKDPHAGFRLAKMIRDKNPLMPVLLQSSDIQNKIKTSEMGLSFIHKYSKSLLHELRAFVMEHFAFGDFVFRDAESLQEVCRVANLKDLQENVHDLPDNVILDYAALNQFSRWLRARALFPIANILESASVHDFTSAKQIKQYIYDAIAWYRHNKGRGIIAKFYHENYDEYLRFTRIGDGLLGGKARGLAFIDNLISRNELFDKYKDILVTIPRTLVITTEVFDEFIESNDLLDIALSEAENDEILQRFVKAKLPVQLCNDLRKFIEIVENPIAIRSSSLLEDSHYQPFAGIYSTYMIPSDKEVESSLKMLAEAIKSVYASTYFKDSKAYISVTKNVIEEEKMGVVLQEICGQRYGDRFYPTISGVARSINFYPIDGENANDGIVDLAFGLGKHVVDGGNCLRFSPKYPKNILQLSNINMALKDTQKKFMSLDMRKESFRAHINEGVNIFNDKIDTAVKDGTLKHIVSIYDHNDNALRDGYAEEGIKVVTFANILKYNYLPIANIISELLTIGHKEMNNPVEIEFAVSLNRKGKAINNVFNVLQIRPIVDSQESINTDMSIIADDACLLKSDSALGNGVIEDLQDVIYVKPESFNPANNVIVADIIGNLNEYFLKSDKHYILIGPGRWGSSDSWLGIPIRWAQISMARLIVEAGMSNYRVDPSQGTHFFQNLTSFQVGYFTVNSAINQGIYDIKYLNAMPAVYEDDYVRHVKFDKPVQVLIDGKKSLGLVIKPEFKINPDTGDDNL